MTTREIPLKESAAPVIGVVLDAPSVLKASELSSFHAQVEKRFRLVPNFFVSAPDAPEVIERLWAFAAAAYLDNPIQHSSKSGFLSSSRVSVRPATALCATADFLWAMELQRATRRLRRRPLSRWSSFCKHLHLGGGTSNRFTVAWRE